MRTLVWSHSGSVARDFDELVDRYSSFELASPRRSTVPLLAYWGTPYSALDALSAWTGILFPDRVMLSFEHQVPVQRGSGKASHTDLMILSNEVVVAIEAKHTEQRYEDVKKWLGGPPTNNRGEVLRGWIDLINSGAGSSLDVDQVLNLPYQLVHRAASACHPRADAHAVVYQVFEPREEERRDYINDLAKLADLVKNARLGVYLVICRLKRKEPYLKLERKWDEGERHLGEVVKMGLKRQDLIDVQIVEVPVKGVRSTTIDIQKARRLFLDAGLTFPEIPKELAGRLRERGSWLFASRDVLVSPYNLHHYVSEAVKSDVEDYAVIAHSGHGVNSYAVHYFVVLHRLSMFLQIGWGGIYSCARADAAKVRVCFSMADKIVRAVRNMQFLKAGERLTIVASDFCRSYWLPPGVLYNLPEETPDRDPAGVLSDALQWLER